MLAASESRGNMPDLLATRKRQSPPSLSPQKHAVCRGCPFWAVRTRVDVICRKERCGNGGKPLQKLQNYTETLFQCFPFQTELMLPTRAPPSGPSGVMYGWWGMNGSHILGRLRSK